MLGSGVWNTSESDLLSQRPYVGRLAGARAASAGLADIIAAREHSESLLRCCEVITHMHWSHARPQARNIWRN